MVIIELSSNFVIFILNYISFWMNIKFFYIIFHCSNDKYRYISLRQKKTVELVLKGLYFEGKIQ